MESRRNGPQLSWRHDDDDVCCRTGYDRLVSVCLSVSVSVATATATIYIRFS